MSYFDHCTNQCELEVKRIIHVQNLANQLPDTFIDIKKVIKSHISVANAPTWIDVPERQLTNESQIHLKRERLIGSKDLTPQKRRTQRKISTSKETNIKQKVSLKAYGKKKAPTKAYDEQKGPTPTEAYGEQEAPLEAYNEQKTPEEV